MKRLLALLEDAVLGFLKSWTRMTSFVGKEIIEIIRRPWVLVSLVLGPFLIMALFGIGYSGQQRPLETVLVIPQSSNLPRDVAYYQQYVGTGIHLQQVTDNLAAARARLQREQIDLLVVAPADVEGQFLAGKQSVIDVEYNQIDPVLDNYARFIAERQVQDLNKLIIQTAVQQGSQIIVQKGGPNVTAQIPPQVIAAPTEAQTQNLAPLKPTVLAYYAPAVLALILQHLGVTLTALSLVRERLSGAMDVFRVAPVRTLEILVGKYLAYAFFDLVIAGIVALLLLFFLHIPLLGSPREFALVVLLLTFASLGLGLFISTVVDSERQAVQLSMLVLLASVFFSGFVLPLNQFLPVARYFAYIIPVTHGIRLLQDVMLRGGTYALWELWALGGIGVLLFLVTALTLRRNMATA